MCGEEGESGVTDRSGGPEFQHVGLCRAGHKMWMLIMDIERLW